MAATHENKNVVNIFLAAQPPPRQGFGTPLLIVTTTGNSLNGDTVRSYGSTSDVDADLTASYISAQTADFLTTAFAQQPRISQIKVTSAGVAAYDTAYTAARAADDDFYVVCLDTVLAADVVAVAGAVETDGAKLFLGMSDAADWLTSGVPAAYSAMAAYERSPMLYHDITTEPAALAWGAARSVFDPDIQSVPWSGRLRSILAYTTALTTAQRDLAIANNINLMLPYGAAPQFVDNGVNMVGRPLYEILSGDWLRARLEEDFAAMRLQATDRGEKILVNAGGQARGLAIIRGRLEQGEKAGHFSPGQTRATALDITADDLTNQRLRFDVEAQVGVDAIRFTINVYEQTTPLAAA